MDFHCLDPFNSFMEPDSLPFHPLLFFGFFIFDFYLFTYCWPCWVSLAAHGLSLTVASGGYSLVAVASPVAEHRLEGAQASVVAAPGLQSVGSVVVALGLSSFEECGILMDQGSNPGPFLWQVDS